VKKFIFVQAVVKVTDLSNPGSISFRHTEVVAAEEADAYEKGQVWAERNFQSCPETETVNDYVIPVL